MSTPRCLAKLRKLAADRQESGRTPRTYADYRKMLEEKDLDIVLVATPDHWHALAAIAAIEAGAHLYLQKPISVDVIEGEAILAAARKHNRVVQVGTQRRSTPHLIDARDKIIRTGMLGKIGFVETYCYYHMRVRGQFPPIDPPDYLDWNAWTGPAPMRPYHERIHPRSWRSYKEYSNGIVGDMCIHMLDMVRWMLELGWPSRVSSSGGIFVDKDSVATVPDTQNRHLRIPRKRPQRGLAAPHLGQHARSRLPLGCHPSTVTKACLNSASKNTTSSREARAILSMRTW